MFRKPTAVKVPLQFLHRAIACALLALAAALWLSTAGALGRTAEEPAITKLEAARTEHDKAIAEALKKLTDVVDSRLDTAKDNGDLKAVERLTEVKKSIESDGKLPEGTKDNAILNAARQRDRAVDIANTRFLAAYDTAVRELTKAGKLDEAKAIQKEKENFAVGKKGGGDLNAVEFVRLGGSRGLPSFLEPNVDAFNAKEGLRFNKRVYVRSKDAALLRKDFVFDVVLSPDWEGGSLNKTLYVGVGEGLGGGQRNPYNVPINSAFVSIQPPSINDGEVVLANGPEYGKGDKIGNIREKGNHLVRVEKKGEVLTFSICTNYDGKFSPDITHAVTNLKEYVPGLTEKNTHVFLGGAGTYKQLRFVYNK